MISADFELFLFLGGSIALIVLALVCWFLAVHHDKVVALAGPLEEERAIEARVLQKREELAEINDEIEKRKQAFENLSDRQSEVDALERKREMLLQEWSQLSERKLEVEKVRQDTEEARSKKLDIDSQLATANADLDEVRDKLARAEMLVAQINALKGEHEKLVEEVESLRDNHQRLEEAEARVSQMKEEVTQLEGKEAKCREQIQRRELELSDVVSRLAEERSSLGEVERNLGEKRANLAAADVKEQEVRRLEARKAQLESEIGEAAGGGQGEGAYDRLRDLRDCPNVVERLASLPLGGSHDERDALVKVNRYFRSLGLNYPDRILRAFHTSMKVNDTSQMTVLAGISGTGKSQLPRRYAEGMGIGFLQVPVQPRWDSPQDLMGFYNYIEKRYRPTELARALYFLDSVKEHGDSIKDRMLLILLDEMNLARVEYYFSDFLSRLEARPSRDQEEQEDLWSDAGIELEIPGDTVTICPGYNLLFAGTMNEDESTQALSEKVIDRANVLRFGAPREISGSRQDEEPGHREALDRTIWNSWCDTSLPEGDLVTAKNYLQNMLELMQEFGRPFGHRLGRAILSYAEVYPRADQPGDLLSDALADQIEMRLLPRLRGVDVEEKSVQFQNLCEFATNLGDEQLGEAIGNSVEEAQATGQFVWKGVVR